MKSQFGAALALLNYKQQGERERLEFCAAAEQKFQLLDEQTQSKAAFSFGSQRCSLHCQEGEITLPQCALHMYESKRYQISLATGAIKCQPPPKME